MEIWRDITDFVGLYQVSNIGRVRSLDREVMHRGSITNRKGKIKCQRLVGKYWMVGLCRGGKGYNLLVHRLVATVFIPNVENKPEVNHKDLDGQNNNIENLEWTTHIENVRHAIDNGVKFGGGKRSEETCKKISKSKQGEKHPKAKLTNEKVLLIRKFHSEGKTIKELAIQFGVSRDCIQGIIKRITWMHL